MTKINPTASGWYSCVMKGTKQPTLSLWWNGWQLQYSPEAVNDMPPQDGYENFVRLIPYRDFDALFKAHETLVKRVNSVIEKLEQYKRAMISRQDFAEAAAIKDALQLIKPLSQPEEAATGNSLLNHDHDQARSLHRIVRAMHDGECPACHEVHDSSEMWRTSLLLNLPDNVVAPSGWQCPACGFHITEAEGEAIFQIFAPFMTKNLEVFRDWRAARNQGVTDAGVVDQGNDRR